MAKAVQNCPTRQQLAMGQPNSIQAAPRKSTGKRWHGRDFSAARKPAYRGSEQIL